MSQQGQGVIRSVTCLAAWVAESPAVTKVSVPGRMEIGIAAPRQSDLNHVPAAVIVVGGMEWLMDVGD